MVDPSLNKIFYQIDNSPIEMYGVNNISVIKNISFAEQYSLGGIYNPTLVNAPQQIEVSIDRNLISNDDLFKYTGDIALKNIYIYNGGYYYYNISNLYLTSYSIGFSVGEIPRISNKFINYSSEIEEVTSIAGIQNANKNYDIPKLGCTSIDGLDPYGLNIFSFDYELEMNRQPYFSIGNSNANKVSLIFPIKINTSINFKLKNETSSIDYFTNELKQPNFNFDIKTSGTGVGSAMTFPVKNAQLISSEIVASSNNTLEFKTKFLGYYGL